MECLTSVEGIPYVMKLAMTFLLVAWLAASAFAQEHRPTYQAYLNHTAVQPGQQAVIALVVEIPEGLHSQSNTPTENDYVPFAIEMEPHAGVKLYPPVYPKGEDLQYELLGKLNVYSGRVIAYVPIELAPDVAAGDIKINGRLQIQLCDDASCFRPFRGATALPFTIETKVVPITQPVAMANDEHFQGFDPRVFASGVSATGPPSATTIQLFGWTFELGNTAYALAFMLALAVGIIFNLMPCVLPVVPLKAIGFYEASQHNRATCFLLGVVFSLGLLAVFAVLAVFVIVGDAAWGELFSRGWFVWSIVAVLLIMAAGQFGAFSVMLPSSVYGYVPSHTSYIGNFLFGGFTAILSTPCTAPMFLGLLLWAASQQKWIGVALIMTVGLGMALPYLVLAAFPELARKMPRTGAWSELLKQFMAFLLLAVAAWFAAGRVGTGNGYMWIVFAIVLAGCVFLVIRAGMIAVSRRAMAFAGIVSVVICGAMLYFTMQLAGGSLIAWEPYSQQRFEEATAEGKIVMLEFTANWCANCKELESRVFTDERAAEAIKSLNVVPIRADLTLDSAPGWQKLREISKSGGIPLTMIYSPALESPISLSSVYATENLVSALRQAAGPQVTGR